MLITFFIPAHTEIVDVTILEKTSEVMELNRQQILEKWYESYEARVESLYINKEGGQILERFRVLQTWIGPELVSTALCSNLDFKK